MYINIIPPRILGFTLCSLMSFSLVLADYDDEEEEPEQDFLFLNEEAYVQEEGEWQIDLSTSFAGGLEKELESEDELSEAMAEFDEFTFELAMEYGFTEDFQVEMELLWMQVDGSLEDGADPADFEFDDSVSGIADAEIAFAYRLLEESEEQPTVTIALEIMAPIGDDEFTADTWGFGPSIAVSKSLERAGYIHANLGYEIVNGAVEGDEEVDERELFYGVSYAYPLSEESYLLLEIAGATEKEESIEEGSETTRTLYFAPGYVYETEGAAAIGISAALGLTDDSFDWIASARISWEF